MALAHGLNPYYLVIEDEKYGDELVFDTYTFELTSDWGEENPVGNWELTVLIYGDKKNLVTELKHRNSVAKFSVKPVTPSQHNYVFSGKIILPGRVNDEYSPSEVIFDVIGEPKKEKSMEAPEEKECTCKCNCG